MQSKIALKSKYSMTQKRFPYCCKNAQKCKGLYLLYFLGTALYLGNEILQQKIENY